MNPQQLKQLEQAATPGPWCLSRSEFIGIVRRWEEDGRIHYERDVAEAFGPETDDQFETDAALTCVMRNALPHLIELWEAATKVIDDESLGIGYPIDSPEMEEEVRRYHGDALTDLALALTRLDDAEKET